MDHFKSVYWICYNTASVLCFSFLARDIWDLNSLNRFWTCTSCIGRWSFNHWTQGSPPFFHFWKPMTVVKKKKKVISVAIFIVCLLQDLHFSAICYKFVPLNNICSVLTNPHKRKRKSTFMLLEMPSLAQTIWVVNQQSWVLKSSFTYLLPEISK